MVDKVVTKVVLKGDSSDANSAAKSFEAQWSKSFKAVGKSRTDLNKKFLTGAKHEEDFQKKQQKAAERSRVAFAAATTAAVALGAAFAKGISLAQNYDRALDKRTKALRNQNEELGSNSAMLDEQARTLQQLTGVSVEQITTAQAMAINMGVQTDQVDDLIRATVRLAKVTGQDFDGAMKQLVKTLGGSSGELGENLAAVAALTKAQRQAGGAIKIINEQWAESLGLSVNYSDQLMLLESNFEELLGTVGAEVTDSGTVVSSLKLLNDLFATAATNADVTRAVFESFGMIVRGVTPAVGALHAAMKLLVDLTTDDITLGDIGAGWGDPPKKKKKKKKGGGAAGKGPPISGIDWDQILFDQSAAAVAQIDIELALTAKIQDIREEERAEEARIWAETNEARAQAADEEMADAEDRAEFILSLEQRIADGKEEIAETNAARIALIQEEQAMETATLYEMLADNIATIMENMTQAAASSLIALVFARKEADAAAAKAEAVAADATATTAEINAAAAAAESAAVAASFEVALAGFLQSQGTQMVGRGIAHGFEAAGMIASMWGASPPGWALAGIATAEVAAGAAMIGGSVAIDVPEVSFGGGGGAAGGSAGQAQGDSRESNITIVVYGEPSARLGKMIEASVSLANSRGI